MKDSKHWGTSRLAMMVWITVVTWNLIAHVARLWVRPLASLVFALTFWGLAIWLAAHVGQPMPQ